MPAAATQRLTMNQGQVSDSHLECRVRDAVHGSLWQLYDLITSYLFTINSKLAISIILSTGAQRLSIIYYLL